MKIVVEAGADDIPVEDLSGSFSIVAGESEAGLAARETLRLHLETGAPVTLTKDMLAGVELPRILSNLGFINEAAEWQEVRLGARKGAPRDFFLDFEATDGIRSNHHRRRMRLAKRGSPAGGHDGLGEVGYAVKLTQFRP